MEFNENDSVRIIDNPGKIGVITGKKRKQAEEELYQIKFPDKFQYFAGNQIELFYDIPEDPLDLFEEKRFGRIENLQQLLNYVRLSGKLIDHIYSLETTNTDFYAFQFKPVLKILESSSNGILIADEVGLGKTIEAGLIWTELKSRFEFRKLFVLCPAMLREKWKLELKRRFGIDAEILNAKNALINLKEGINDLNHQFAIISSIEGLRPSKDLSYNDRKDTLKHSNALAQFLKDHEHEDKLIDLLIIDEAHYLRNRQTQNAKLGRLLRSVSEYIVLLTATPVHLRSEDLFNLIQLVDEDIFSSQVEFDYVLMANEPLVKMRDKLLQKNISIDEYKRLLYDVINNPILENLNQIKSLGEVIPTENILNDVKFRSTLAHKLDTINFLGNVISRNRKRDVFEKRVIREPIPISIELSDIEAEFYYSVSDRIKEYCVQYSSFEAFLQVMPQRQMSSSMPAALRYWQNKKNNYVRESIYEDIGSKDLGIEENKPISSELIGISEEYNFEELKHHDSKFKKLSEIIGKLLETNDSKKIIVFSYFRATIDYLSERLSNEGVGNIVLKGGGNTDKELVVSTFKSDENINVLLSSEIGSEGIDLQFSRVIINYDLPWNPMKIEQRIGRIDRIGQESEKIQIFNFFYENTIDSRIYRKLYLRLKIFEKTIGLPEAILGEKINHLTNEILTSKLTAEQEEERINQTALAIENKIIEEENLEENAFNLLAYGDYIINKVTAARDLRRWISEKDIISFVSSYMLMNYPGSQFVEINKEDFIFDINLSNWAKGELESFIKQHKFQIKTNLYTLDNKSIKCKFSSKISDNRSNTSYEIINQLHPLVKFISYQMKENSDSMFYPAICTKLDKNNSPDFIKEGIYLFVIQKWTIIGIQNKEKLYYRTVCISDKEIEIDEQNSETFILNVIKDGSDWLNPHEISNWSELAQYISNSCLYKANNDFIKFKSEYELANKDRVKFQIDSLKKHLSGREKNLQETKEKLILSKNDSLVKATEGRIQKLRNRVERQILELEGKEAIKSDNQNLCVGIILVK